MSGNHRPLSDLEAAFLAHWRALGYPPSVWMREYAFALPRRFRFDLAHLDSSVAVELDGGTWSGGRHVTGAGYERDCEKANLAAAGGWLVFHVTSTMLRNDPAGVVELIADTMGIKVEATA